MRYNLNDGKIFFDGNEMRRPSILFDADLGVLQGLGEHADMELGLQRLSKGMPSATFVLIDLSGSDLGPEEQCGLLNHLLDVTDPDFLKSLASSMEHGSFGALVRSRLGDCPESSQGSGNPEEETAFAPGP